MTAPAAADARPRLRVILPARDATATLDGCLAALAASLTAAAGAFAAAEIVVVDDGSRDGTAAAAARHGATVLPTQGASQGAAAARNRGAAAADADVLLFVDADVEVETEAVSALLAALAAPGVDAAVGVYAPCDAALGPWSRTKDRSIRINHGRSGRDIAWFWTALGAVRCSAFRRVGGFDVGRFGAGATVEDMDLGLRLSAAGCRIVQVPEARARHGHRFSPEGLLRNDFAKSHAWTRLLLRQRRGAQRAHGSTRGSEAAALACSLTALAGVAATPLTPWAGVPLTAAGLTALAWLLREDLALAHAERGAGEAAIHLLVRALAYPAAGAGAAAGVLAEARDALRGGAR